jgi:hypothetical protein
MPKLTGVIKAGATGEEDDYEYDISDLMLDYVGQQMLALCANEGQITLINQTIDTMDGYCFVYVDFDGSVDADVNPVWDLKLESKHPEAVGLILLEGYKAAEEFANMAERYV